MNTELKTPNLLPFTLATVIGFNSFSLNAEEEKDTKEMDEKGQVIQVTGIRGTMLNTMDIKRDAKGFVDAILATDIGDFPDTNLAESLQRIPGVSIDRKNNEGNQVSVRGFGPSFNLVLLNGRQMPAAATQKQEGDSTQEQSRAFNFAELAAESVAGVEVHKTSKASVSSGGIGATINILTAKPLSLQDNQVSFTIKSIFDSSVETGDSVTPEISGIFSKKFADDKLGVLFNGSFSERHNRQNFVATDGWLRVSDNGIDTSAIDTSVNPTSQIWLPRNLLTDQSDHERTRANAQVVLQFVPNERVEVSLDYTFSDYEDVIERSQTGVFIESGNVVGSADANGSVLNPTVISNPGAGLGAVDYQGYSDVVKTENESVGFNLGWQAADSIFLNLDYHNSSSESQPDNVSSDFLVILSGPLGSTISPDFTSAVPTASIDDLATSGIYNGSITGHADPFGLRPNIDLTRNQAVKNEVEQFQLHGVWENQQDGALASVNFGFSLTDYVINTNWNFDLGVQGQPLCGQICADQVVVERNYFPSVFPFVLTFNASDIFNNTVADLPSVFDLAFQNMHEISEETIAAYIEFDFETEFNGMPISLLAGVRYENTDVVGTTFQNSPEAMVYVSTTEFRPQFTTDFVEYSLENNYDLFLPNLTMSLEFIEDWLFRFSYGRSVTRSDLNSMKPALTVGDARPGGPYNASQGNPGLLPYVSDNFDLALEWYYDEGSYVAINYFKKFVDNYVISTLTKDTIVGALGYELTDPNPTDDPNFPPNTLGGPNDQMIEWDILSFINGEAAEISGVEIALQHLFGETGFGLQTNATFVDGDIDYDMRALDQSIALTGLSDSANLVVFYEKDGVQTRIAYNWRDEFLLSANQLRQANEPVFIDAYGQWDINVSYAINDNWTVFLDGLNITEENASAHGRFDNQFIYFDDQKARYALGILGSF